MGLRVYDKWNSRNPNHSASIDPYRKYFFICEGSKTEVYYFRKLIDFRKNLGIHALIDIKLLERTQQDITNSHPKKLLEYAKCFQESEDAEFDIGHDKIIVVFDADIFEYRESDYGDIIEKAQGNGFLVGVTNPCFEIFLLLHFQDAYKNYIEPYLEELLKKENLGNHGLAYKLLHQQTNINSKTNEDIGNLAEYVKIAIEEEKFLNQDSHCCKGNVTSNIGVIIYNIMNDKASENNV